MDSKNRLERYMQEDYKRFVTEFFAIETGATVEELQYLYEKYMDQDELTLLNPAFEEMLEYYRTITKQEQRSNNKENSVTHSGIDL